jgi:large subunit ribosomal protein L22
MAEEKKEKKAPAKKAAAPKKEAAPKAEAPKEEKPVKAKKAAKKEEVKEEPKKPAATEARCVVTGVRVTPRKVRLVCDVVRGKNVKEALAILSRLNKAASTPVAKAIKSAAANATNNFGMQEDLLYVAEIQAADGLRIKRFTPRAKGSASPLIRRNTNLRVVVKESK